jgi:hypothetical protein
VGMKIEPQSHAFKGRSSTCIVLKRGDLVSVYYDSTRRAAQHGDSSNGETGESCNCSRVIAVPKVLSGRCFIPIREVYS